jgi:hypothetical protein
MGKRISNRLLAALFFLLPLFALSAAMTPVSARGADATAKPGPDVLVFTNGDKLTGKLDHESDGTVYFNSDSAGKVEVKWDKLKSLKTAEPFAVIKKGVLVSRKNVNVHVPLGNLDVEDGTVTVALEQGAEHVAVGDVGYLIDEATFNKNVHAHQKLSQGITGAVTAGLSTVSSTQNSVSINTSILLTRAVPAVTWMPPSRRTVLNFSSNYGRISQPATPTVKTNILHGGIEEDEYFNPRFFALQQALFDHNFSQGLDLQQLYGAGVGYTAIKSDIQELDVTGTVNYTRQQFTAVPPAAAVTNNIIGSTIGDNYMRKVSKKIVFTEVGAFNPAWNHPSDYSANVALGATFALFKNFGWSVGLVDSYLNNPPAGFKGNSVQFNTGLTYNIQ